MGLTLQGTSPGLDQASAVRMAKKNLTLAAATLTAGGMGGGGAVIEEGGGAVIEEGNIITLLIGMAKADQ